MNARIAPFAALFLLLAAASFAQSSAVYLEGDVTIDKAPASIGDPVAVGSVVQTDAQGLAEISFRGKNVIRVGPGASFVFDPSNLQVGSQLNRGSLSLVLKNLVGAAGRNFVVRTGNAVAGVRGTSFFIQAIDAVTTYVCLCNGVIHLDDPAGTQARVVEASHHKAFWFRRSGDSVVVTDAPMLSHTDEEMEKLAARIGTSIDWTQVDTAAVAGTAAR